MSSLEGHGKAQTSKNDIECLRTIITWQEIEDAQWIVRKDYSNALAAVEREKEVEFTQQLNSWWVF